MIRKVLFAGAFALAGSLGTTSNAAPIDLGFIMDMSGSVGGTNYLAAMDSLAAALGANIPIPTMVGDNVYTITVVSFASGARLDISQEINTAADLAAVVAAVDTAAFGGGGTNYQAAFNALIAASSPMAEIGIVNMMTDGNPNSGSAATGKAALQAAGWDALSFEAVDEFGSGPDTALLAGLGYDQNGDGATIIATAAQITDPLNAAFVLELDNFGADYTTAINAKIQKLVNPSPIPVPGALPALASGLILFGFVARRRRKAA